MRCPPLIAVALVALVALATLAMTFSASAQVDRCIGTAKFAGTMVDAKLQLESALERDQQFRKQTQSANATPKSSPEERQQLLRDQQKIDLDNVKLLDSIVCTLGWPGIDAVGQRASLACEVG